MLHLYIVSGLERVRQPFTSSRSQDATLPGVLRDSPSFSGATRGLLGLFKGGRVAAVAFSGALRVGLGHKGCLLTQYLSCFQYN